MQSNATPFVVPDEDAPNPADAVIAALLDGDEPAEASAEPFEIPSLTLPSGARVEFRSLATVTTENIKWLRKAMDTDGAGTFLGELFERGATLLITAWDALEPATGRPLPLPRDDKKAYGKLGYLDGRAIEKHLRRHLLDLVDLNGSAGK